MKTYNDKYFYLLDKYLTQKIKLKNLNDLNFKINTKINKKNDKFKDIKFRKEGILVFLLLSIIICFLIISLDINNTILELMILLLFLMPHYQTYISNKRDRKIINDLDKEIIKTINKYLDSDFTSLDSCLNNMEKTIKKETKLLTLIKKEFNSDIINSFKNSVNMKSEHCLALKEIASYHKIKLNGFKFRENENLKLKEREQKNKIIKLLAQEKQTDQDIKELYRLSNKLLNKNIINI